MKLLKLILLLITPYLFGQNNALTINGKTNMNTFKCVASGFQGEAGSAFKNGRLPDYQIRIKDFDCKGKMITSDFRKTLNADRFPYMNIRFVNLKKISAGKYIAAVEVKLMNRLREYQVNLNRDGKNYTAKQTVKFTDFGIDPPKHMGGMVVVQDALNLAMVLQEN